jgi:phosphohistidine phosphatase
VELQLLRHGVAEEGGPDEDPPLTEDGAARMRLAARGMRALELRPAVVLTSPLRRAHQTAQIVCDELGVELVEDDRLRPGMRPADLDEAVGALPERPARVMACGHQPDLAEVVAALLGGGRVEFMKGALAVLEAERVAAGAAYLRAAYPPHALRLMAGAGG